MKYAYNVYVWRYLHTSAIIIYLLVENNIIIISSGVWVLVTLKKEVEFTNNNEILSKVHVCIIILNVLPGWHRERPVWC